MVRILRPHTQPPSSVSTVSSSSPTSSPSKRVLPIDDNSFGGSSAGDGGGKCPVIIVHENDHDDEEEGTKTIMRGTNRTDDTTIASSLPLKENGGNNVVRTDGNKPVGQGKGGMTSNETRLQPTTSPSPVLPNLSMQSMATTAPATANSSTSTSATTITIISAPIARRKSCQELLLLQPTKSCFRTSMGKLGSKSSNCLESMDGIILKEGGDDGNNNGNNNDGYDGDCDVSSSFNVVTTNSAHTKARRNVSFHQIEIAEHAYELGDNPSVADGCPVQLGWDVQRTVRMNVDEYEGGAMYGGMGEAEDNENDENDEVGISSPRRRRTRQELRLSSEYRKEAALQAGWTTAEVAVAALRARHEAWRRRRSIQQHLEGWDGWHYRLEKATRTIKKVASMPTIFIASPTTTTTSTTAANRKKKKGHTNASMTEQEQAQPTTRRRRSLHLRGRQRSQQKDRMEENVHCDDNPRAELARETERMTTSNGTFGETLGNVGGGECATTIQQHIGVSYEDDDVVDEEVEEQERSPAIFFGGNGGDDDEAPSF